MITIANVNVVKIERFIRRNIHYGGAIAWRVSVKIYFDTLLLTSRNFENKNQIDRVISNVYSCLLPAGST
ncbi:MAG TPA: hypothetical protein VK622_03750, partial [Puia sp.]|nr:hypothetical protein [Puia sp.]